MTTETTKTRTRRAGSGSLRPWLLGALICWSTAAGAPAHPGPPGHYHPPEEIDEFAEPASALHQTGWAGHLWAALAVGAAAVALAALRNGRAQPAFAGRRRALPERVDD